MDIIKKKTTKKSSKDETSEVSVRPTSKNLIMVIGAPMLALYVHNFIVTKHLEKKKRI